MYQFIIQLRDYAIAKKPMRMIPESKKYGAPTYIKFHTWHELEMYLKRPETTGNVIISTSYDMRVWNMIKISNTKDLHITLYCNNNNAKYIFHISKNLTSTAVK